MDAVTQPHPGTPRSHLRAIIERARARARRRRVLFASLLVLLGAAAAMALVLKPEPSPPDPAAPSKAATGQVPIPEVSACSGDGRNLSAYGWGGKVAGVGCHEAGVLILKSFIPRFQEGPLAASNFNSYETLERTAPRPGEFKAAGYTCGFGAYGADGVSGGWQIRCSTGDRSQRISWRFTP